MCCSHFQRAYLQPYSTLLISCSPPLKYLMKTALLWMEYRNFIPVPRLCETGFGVGSYRSHTLPDIRSGHLSNPEEMPVAWNTGNYGAGMPAESFLQSSAAVNNPVIQNLQQSSISASTYGPHHAEYFNNFIVDNGRRFHKRKRDDSTTRYCSSGSRDVASLGGLSDGQRNVWRRVGTGFTHENSSNTSMGRFDSAGYYLGELHEQSSYVNRATTMEVNTSVEAHHLPLVLRNDSNIGSSSGHNYASNGNSAIHLQNPHLTPIESTRNGHRESFQWNDTAHQRESSSHQHCHWSGSSINTMAYGSQSGAEPHVSTSRFPRPSSFIPERSRRTPRRTVSRRPFRRSQTNPEATGRILFPEGARVPNSVDYRSEFFTDNHRDMYLDIDNMSYEELLALGERIGDVCTGLSEKNISKCLKKKIFLMSHENEERASDESGSRCTVCQEEYTDKEELGVLDCGHGYHYDCIKQWLMMKNVCPICKATAIRGA